MKRSIFLFTSLFVLFGMTWAQQQIEVSPGCEDFAFDSSRDRLLLSCDPRKDKSLSSRGALYSLDLKTHQLRSLRIREVDLPSFHPHGISLVKVDGRQLLYVISHQRQEQNHAAKRGQDDVLIFEIKGNEAHFIANIGNDDVFNTPNDLVALPSGEVYMTNPTALRDSVLYYDPWKKSWRSVVSGHLYPNGIHIDGKRLFVSSSLAKKLYEYEIIAPGIVRGKHILKSAMGVVDNITQEAGSHNILVSGAIERKGFLKHLFNPKNASPGNVFKMDLKTERFYEATNPAVKAGISAPSVAFSYNGRLYLGQVFNSYILIVDDPMWMPR